MEKNSGKASSGAKTQVQKLSDAFNICKLHGAKIM